MLTNRLLESLPPRDKAEIMGLLQPVALPLRTVLFEIGETPRYVHFPTSGLASVVTALSGGETVEVCIVGRDGMAEALHALGPQRGETRCFMQVEGTGLRMDFVRFCEEFHRRASLHMLVLRYVQYQSLVMAQLAACNRLHEVEERMARWLLMVSDRIDSPVIHLTQELLAEMIGARRSTVTLTAGALQRAGVIEYSRGRIRIVNRQALEDTSCDCFRVIERLFNNIYR